jgi:hypothetical protein
MKRNIVLSLIIIFIPILLILTIMNYNNQENIMNENEIKAFFGSKPLIDGNVTYQDKWFECMEYVFNQTPHELSLRAKHDDENLYLLFTTNSKAIHPYKILFEDDGKYPERELDTWYEDCKYIGVDGRFRDSNYCSGWTIVGDTGGDIEGGYASFWNGEIAVSEWWLPLSTGSRNDINVTGRETVGFAFVSNLINVHIGGIDPLDPKTWLNLTIMYEEMDPM